MIELPSGVNINNLIDDLRIFSWEASDILIYYSQILKDKNNKSKILLNGKNEDPVTLADLKVNEIIIQRINEKYKNTDWEIISEENAKIGSNICNTNSDWCWLLDPLDGTKDFIQGTGNYAMHLALNFKQKPYLGIVLIPEKDELWISNGKKVWCEIRDNYQPNPKLSRRKHLNDMVIVTSKNHRNPNLRNLINRIGFKEVIIMGSIGCKVASILRGDSDIYISLSLPGKSSPKDWDFAAPEVVLKTAGGAITNLENKDLTYNQKNFEQGGIIIASSDKETHKELCLQIKEIIKKYEIYPLND